MEVAVNRAHLCPQDAAMVGDSRWEVEYTVNTGRPDVRALPGGCKAGQQGKDGAAKAWESRLIPKSGFGSS